MLEDLLLKIQTPTPAPMMREMMLVMTTVNMNLLSLLAELNTLKLFWLVLEEAVEVSFHCFGGKMLGRELQSQIKSDMGTSLSTRVLI